MLVPLRFLLYQAQVAAAVAPAGGGRPRRAEVRRDVSVLLTGVQALSEIGQVTLINELQLTDEEALFVMLMARSIPLKPVCDKVKVKLEMDVKVGGKIELRY